MMLPTTIADLLMILPTVIACLQQRLSTLHTRQSAHHLPIMVPVTTV